MSHPAIPLPQSASAHPWPHRVAVLLVCATFPLIWVGGLVTTYDAGMAVPDWPSTYGYNLFLYPWQTWLFGPFDLFIEHGHRLLGAIVGMIAIALLIVVFRCDTRHWVRGLAVATLTAVIFQGILGGIRVTEGNVQFAKIHAVFGPLFFGLCVAMAVVTSRLWRAAAKAAPDAHGRKLPRLATITAGLVMLQIAVGAHLRHLPVDFSPGMFRGVVFFHLILAAAIVVHVALLAVRVLRRHRNEPALVRPAMALVVLILLQLALGSATWVVNYAWPSWMQGFAFTSQLTLQAGGFWQAIIVTGHQAMGSLLLAFAVVLALRFRAVVARQFTSQRAERQTYGGARMSMSSITTSVPRATTLSRVADYVELTKPRIAALVLVCVAAGAFVSSWGQFEPLVLIHALVGTSLIAASASGFNHWLERHSDARMARTASRPLPAGRLSSREVVAFGVVCGVAGFAYLLLLVNPLAALVGAATWITYVLLYTPLKSRTPLNTHVGAVSGALPVLIGAAAVSGRVEPALALFGILLFWQFPHFMAIAWIYREEYARAGLVMSPVVDPSGRSAGLTAVLNALVLLPLSYFAVAHYPPAEAGVFLVAALVLGAGQLACALAFCWRRDEVSARRLLRASLIYLPAILLLLIALPLL